MKTSTPNLIEKSKDFPKRITQCCGIVGQRIYDRSGYIPLTCPRCGSEDYDDEPNSKPFVPQKEKSNPNYIESVLKEFDEKLNSFLNAKNYLSLVSNGQNQYDEGGKMWTEYQKDIDIAKEELEKETKQFKSFLSTALEKQQKDIEQIIEKSRTVDEKFGIGVREETARQQILVDLSLLKE